MQKITLFTYYNQYESKRYFTECFAKSLERLGVEVQIIDPKGGLVTAELLHSIQKFSPDFLFSFNATIPDKSGKFLSDYLQIPTWTALVDPAFYAVEMAKSPYFRFATVDREDCKWLLDNGVKGTFFWPHAVEKDPLLVRQDRIYDVVFLGTFTDFEALRKEWSLVLKKEEVEVLERAIEMMFSPPAPSLMQALVSSVSSFPFLDVKALNFKRLFYYLDNYTRGKDRFELISSIKSVKVHVFGEPSWNNPKGSKGWKDLENIVFHPPVSYSESFKITSQAKISLNSMPFFHHGSHERVLNALVSGAVPLTTQNGFIQEFFNPGEDLLTYRSGEWEGIDELVLQTLNGNFLEIAESGRKKVLKDHTWDIRAYQFLDNAL